jgi:hypothetical protein
MKLDFFEQPQFKIRKVQTILREEVWCKTKQGWSQIIPPPMNELNLNVDGSIQLTITAALGNE